MSYGVGHRCGSDPALLWLRCRPPPVAPIQPLAWGTAQKRQKKKKKKKKKPNQNFVCDAYFANPFTCIVWWRFTTTPEGGTERCNENQGLDCQNQRGLNPHAGRIYQLWAEAQLFILIKSPLHRLNEFKGNVTDDSLLHFGCILSDSV